MSDLVIKAKVNGRDIKRLASTEQRLLDFLRDEIELTGTKEGCGAGECGTCSVFVDGVLMKSCLLPVAKADGTEIETVESLADHNGLNGGLLTTLQQAFHKTGASQCGYCIPGMVMAATSTLRDNPHAGTEEIKERVGGNICRCTGYQKIIEAIELTRDVSNGTLPATALEPELVEGSYIGHNTRRTDAPGKVSGQLKYAGDMVMARMLHMQVLRSPHAHALIKSIDTSAAEALPGVECVITSSDVPGVDGFGVFKHDQPIMARDKVRHVGEAVAAVAAEDVVTAKKAVALIKVEYEELEAVFDPTIARNPDAPTLHDYAPDNVVKHIPIRKGDVEKGFAEADLVMEHTYQTQAVEHAYLEPEAGLAYVDADGVVVIHSPSQNITHHRHMLAPILDLPISKVRFVMSPVGGGFGGKEDMIYQGMLALAAMKTGRPVRLVFTREESIIASAKRHPAQIKLKMGLRNDGRITAIQFEGLCDGGAYGMSTEGVMRKMAILGCGPYDIENAKIDTYGVYTNNTPSGAFRTFGAMQGHFATESHIDRCAEALGMDPFELRRINRMRDGTLTYTKQKLGSVSMQRNLDAAKEASNWQEGAPAVRGPHRTDLNGPGTRKPCTLGARLDTGNVVTLPGGLASPDAGKVRGRGVAASWYGIARTATIDRAAAWVEMDDGGTAKVVTGVTEIGEGILTVLQQIAADELGIKPEDVVIGDNDTARAPEAAHAGATRQTYMIGNSVALASRDARSKFDAVIADHFDVEIGAIKAFDGEVFAEGTNKRMSMSDAIALCKSRGVVPVGSASFSTDATGIADGDGAGRPWQAYVFGCQVAEVEVDTVTGEVQVLGIWAAHDVGRAVNPRGVEGQIEGGVVQGVGQALMEDYKLENGHTTTHGFAKYILPTSLDVPHVTSIIVEDPDPLGPLGVKGIGEPALVPTCPAITNAIYDAIGVRIDSLPATPEKVLEGLRKKRTADGVQPQAAE